ncbi:MAG: manganese efflux pump MntP family protein [Coriobacteriales bacterium]|nr:manganese efflux pump MntP family protein [Coriobacteriales bacterium]
MGILEIAIIGLALSMDAFAVTVSNTCACQAGGAAAPPLPRSRLIAMPVVFGAFQGVMPLIGYFAGSFAAQLIDQYAGIVSLVILGFIGGKMVWDGARSLRADTSGSSCPNPSMLTIPALLAQGVATSIDALIIGVSLLAARANIFVASPLIAAITCACCIAALGIGRRFGVLLGDKAQIAGGVVLVLIGLKAFFF